MKFSDRLGFTTPKSVLQIDSIDADLLMKLWNELFTGFFGSKSGSIKLFASDYKTFLKSLWGDFLGRNQNEFPQFMNAFVNALEATFFKMSWFEVYNLIEFIAANDYLDNDYDIELFEQSINSILEKGLSGYRLINKSVVPITTQEEMDSISTALATSDKFTGTKLHLKVAIELLSSKTNPDYRNSIKESISAVESVASIIAEKPKATLGTALKVIETKYSLHKALKESFEKFYGYTSDADGIRHKLLDNNVVIGQADAVYMLISCSAFVNYLVSKFAE